MKKMRVLALVLVAALMCGAALADSISMNGTVTAATTHEVYAPIGGTVDGVSVKVGDSVCKGDTIATLRTVKVYAEQSGVITGVFGQPGDAAEEVTKIYGAVMYIEGEQAYTIAASTENAYNSTETKFVHVGEKVYLSSYSDGEHKGEGVITSIQGTDYTVEVTDGVFLLGETVSVFREDSLKSATRIGRGPISRTDPVAAKGSGSIVSIAVSDGDTVKKGDLLFETLDGSFDGYYMSGSTLDADADGTVAQINVKSGSAVVKDSVVAVLYPEDAIRIEAQVDEADLGFVKVGDAVTVELLWNQDDDVIYDGIITGIPRVATESAAMGDDNATYTVYVDFTPDENTRYGMSAIVTTLED